jgi:arylsulfatase
MKLVNLNADIGEEKDVSDRHPDVVKTLLALAEKAREDLGDGDRPGKNQRPPGEVEAPVPLLLPGTSFPPSDTEFRLKKGDILDQDRSPHIANKPFAVSASVEINGQDGIIVAHGGLAVGYALFIEDGKPAFCVRTSREKEVTIRGDEKLSRGSVKILGELGKGGGMTLSVNGEVAATGRSGGWITEHPAEPLSVGRDERMAVGSYEAPFPFRGEIREVRVEVR